MKQPLLSNLILSSHSPSKTLVWVATIDLFFISADLSMGDEKFVMLSTQSQKIYSLFINLF